MSATPPSLIPVPQGTAPLSSNTSATLLAAVGGYVDTIGFVALFGLFTAHVTGNFVLIGAELARPGHGVLLKLLAFPAFILAVAASRVIALWCEQRDRPAIRLILALQAVLLLGFMLAGFYGHPMRGSEHPLAITAGLLGAAAMGLQNGAGRLLLSKLTPHTVMTGNVTQLVLDVTDLLLGHGGADIRSRVHKMLWPIVAFGSGAILGALAFVNFGWAALLPALLTVLFLAWRGIAA
ncbi:Uncharacterized membrane protein YoaK, UPF0700 family [Roseateles sp. YR242]|uniref:YoaK family protein n=1 Tax=Roseateles sp. YR242 TaxID=1855305 RepID=UPI0008BA9752|nr:YoaK family protein [Roseateles sp. YR242]SEL84622.1 Uncharacterized membrane protein YoaK, UPF0700 family [Roseateles sp. YR242]